MFRDCARFDYIECIVMLLYRSDESSNNPQSEDVLQIEKKNKNFTSNIYEMRRLHCHIFNIDC